MKRHIKTSLISCITLIILLTVYALIPVNADGSDSYSLELHLSMTQREDGINHPEDSIGCSFHIINSDLQYLTAEYQKSRNTYVINGDTSTSEEAAIFRVSPDDPSTIKIDNLSAGQYSLQENSLTSGYVSLIDGVSIEISDHMALIDGTELPIENENISLAITYYTPMELPNLYSKDMILRETLAGTLLVLFSGVLLVLRIHKNKKYNLSEKQ